MSHETATNYVYYCCCTQTPPLYKTTEYASRGNYSTSSTCTVVRAKPVYTEATTATKTGFCLEARAMAAVWNREGRRQRRARSASAHERGGGSAEPRGAEARGADLGARTSEREARSGHWRGGRSRRRSLASAEALRERGARAFTGAEARERGARAHTSAKRDPPAASAKRERTLARRRRRCAHERGATVVVSLDLREHAESTQRARRAAGALTGERGAVAHCHNTVPHCPPALSHTAPPH